MVFLAFFTFFTFQHIPTFDAAINGDPDPPPTLSKDGSRTTDHRLVPGALTFLNDRIPIDPKAFLNEEALAVLVNAGA